MPNKELLDKENKTILEILKTIQQYGMGALSKKEMTELIEADKTNWGDNIDEFIKEQEAITSGELNGEYLSVEQRKAIVRKRRMNVSKFLGKDQTTEAAADTTGTGSLSVRKQTIDPAKLVSTPTPEKTQESLAIVVRGIDSIIETLKAEKKQDKKHFSFLRKMVETFKRRRDENKLEFKIFDGLKKTATTLLAPMKSAWQKMLDFIGNVILGRVLFKILEWFGNEENQGKLQSIIKFFKDWWPVMLGGYLLFGNALTSMVSGLLIKMAMWVPQMLLAIGKLMMNPYVAAAVLLGGTAAYLSTKKNKTDQNVDQSVEDVGKEETVNQLKEEKEDKNALERMGGFITGEGQERDEQIQRVETGTEKRYGFFGELDRPAQFNKGGTVPGSGNTDTVPAMLTPGEFVMSKGAVQKYGVDTLEGLNAAAGGTNKPTLMGGYSGGGMSSKQQIMRQTEETGTFGEAGSSISTFQATPEQRKASYAEMGIPSMELWDGSVVPDIGKMGAEKIPAALAQTRQNMVETGASPENIAKLDELIDSPDVQPAALQNSLNRIVPGSTEQVLGDMGDSITASARMNGGGLVQAFQGGGQVRRVGGNDDKVQRVQMGRGAAKRKMEASKITPIKKKKVTVAYAEEKDNMADRPTNKKSEQEIPSFNVTAMRSAQKIKVLGISV